MIEPVMKWLIWNRAIYALVAFLALPYRWLTYRQMIEIGGGMGKFTQEELAETWARF